MNNNSFNLDQDSLQYCSHKENLEIEPKQIREKYKDLYKLEFEKYKHKVFNFEMPMDVNNGESVECFFYYPDDIYLEEQQKENTLLPILFYVHGGGFVVDGLKKLPGELSKLTNSIVVYVNYSLAPEAKYPIALKQCYNVLMALKSNKYQIKNLNTDSISLFGESAGGSIATALSLLLKQCHGTSSVSDIVIQNLVLVYATLNDDFETESYNLFKEGFYLTKNSMKYCYKHYLDDQTDANQITCCPGKATIDQLTQIPVLNTLVITAECDVLRDDGEKYAKKLSDANANVQCFRFNNVIHGFLAFDNLINSHQGQLCLNLISSFIRSDKNNNSNILIKDSLNNKLILKII